MPEVQELTNALSRELLDMSATMRHWRGRALGAEAALALQASGHDALLVRGEWIREVSTVNDYVVAETQHGTVMLDPSAIRMMAAEMERRG